MDNKIEITSEDKEVLKSCWVMTTEHVLDEENTKLKKAITNVLNKTMTSRERSEWGYEYYIKHKQYNEDLEFNKNLLRKWAEILKGSGNANYNYAYAIERVLQELGGNKMLSLIGKRVTTIDGHNGIVIKHFKPTGRNMTVHIKENDGRVWYCPDTDIIEISG